MKIRLKQRASIVAIVICVCIFILANYKFNYGKDIVGGSHFTIDVLVEDLPVTQRSQAIEQTILLFQKRLDSLGISGITVQKYGTEKIIVEVPGIDTQQAEQVKALLKRQGHLEFKLVIADLGEYIDHKQGPTYNNRH